MDDETRAAFAEMRSETQAGFARMERWFELSQGQYNDLRGEVRRVAENVSLLDTRVSGIEESLRSFRDWVTLQFADLRVAIQSLTTRVERLEHRQHGPIG